MATDVEYFTEAYCYALALELHARRGWPLWICHDIDMRDGVHALVRLPDGLYLDVCGARTAQAVKADWHGTIFRRVSPGYFDGWSGDDSLCGPLRKSRVDRVASKLLARLDARP